MHDPPGVKIVQTPQQLPYYFQNLLLFKDAEFLLQGKERILSIFKYNIEVCRRIVEVV